MRRREFVAGLGSVAAWPLAARAQQPAVPVIGIVIRFLPETAVPYLTAFRRGLAETGFVEGRNVAIDARYAQTPERLAELAADLVLRRGVTIIATLGGPAAALAAKAATLTIPIVFETGGDPIRTGLVASLNRPGGNATGFYILLPETEPKLLGFCMTFCRAQSNLLCS